MLFVMLFTTYLLQSIPYNVFPTMYLFLAASSLHDLLWHFRGTLRREKIGALLGVILNLRLHPNFGFQSSPSLPRVA